jgi:hypothetical protein
MPFRSRINRTCNNGPSAMRVLRGCAPQSKALPAAPDTLECCSSQKASLEFVHEQETSCSEPHQYFSRSVAGGLDLPGLTAALLLRTG